MYNSEGTGFSGSISFVIIASSDGSKQDVNYNGKN